MTETVGVDHTHAHRRPVLIGLAGAAALGTATAATKLAASLSGGDRPDLPRLELSSDSSSVDSLTVRLGDDLLPRTAQGAWRSTTLATSTHSMVAFTWTGRRDPRIRIRSRVQGRWTEWQRVALMHEEPDADAAERSATRGTHLLWIGRSDGIHIRVDGHRPADLSLVLLHPRRLRSDRKVAAGAGGPGLMRRTATAKPKLLKRKAWGADESWRDGPPRFNSTLQQVHIHHTASGNDYSEDDVPGLLRGFYRYHTKSLGWSDIGYNFLIDKFGRAWVGRAGGPGKLVRGAHTLGFNATSTGISVIGNYDSVAPNAQILSAVSALAAWKLSRHGLDATGSVTVVSEGSDKFRARRAVSLPVIDGHRDTNDTACPGGLLYAQLPAIRQATQRLIATGGAPVPAVTAVAAPTVSGVAAPGQTLTVNPGSYEPADATTNLVWQRNGTKIPGTRNAASYTPTAEDLGAVIGVKVKTKRTGYTALTSTVTTGTVTTATALKVRTRRGVRKAAVGVRVKGTGTSVRPTGTVTVKVGRQKQTATLVDGRALVRFPRVAGGRRKVAIRYHGSPGFARSKARAKVRVLRKPKRR